jgi:hypothetical protein
MEELVWKIRISVLWLIMGAGLSGAMILQMFVPGFINNIIAGEIEGMEISTGILIVFSLFWIIFLTMAFLTLVLKEKINRYANAILGIFFIFFMIYDLYSSLSAQEFSGSNLLQIFGMIFAFLIFWHAWKWPVKSKVSS